MNLLKNLLGIFSFKKVNPTQEKSFTECVAALIDERVNKLRTEINKQYRTSHLDSKLIAEEAAKMVEIRINDLLYDYREESKKVVKGLKTKTGKVIKDLEDIHKNLNADFWKEINNYVKGRIETSIDTKSKFIYERLDKFESKIMEIPTIEQLTAKKEKIDSIIKSAEYSVSMTDSTIKKLNTEEKKRHDALEHMAKRVSEFSGELKKLRDKIS